MEDEIKKYDPSAIMKNVTDKIKATFAELIPDEEWQKLVEKQVKAFMEDKVGRFNNEKIPSEFATMCQELLKESAKEHIEQYIKDHFQQKFGENNKLIEDAVKDLIVNNASTMFAQLLASAAQSAVSSMQAQLNGQRTY